MSDRPNLDKELDSRIFLDYYWLKNELVDFCRKYNLPTSGGKQELTDRIAYFLDTRKVKPASATVKRAGSFIGEISENSIIETDFVCSEKHRAFFKEHIGKSFSFNVLFQKWLKANSGKTYKDAINAYYRILEEKKNGKTKIDNQFEYNTYIRDFFAANSGKTLDDAIKCWKYKKQQSGHNRYEKEDLIALEQ